MEIEKIYEMFPTNDECLVYLEKVRWQGKPTCPYCSSARSTAVTTERRYHCHSCNTSYSATTVFHRTHLPLQTWFLAISLIFGERQAISSRKLSKALNVNRNTAWLIVSRIDRAVKEAKQRDLLHALVIR